VLRKDGEYCGASLWNKPSAKAQRGAALAVCQGDGESRLENSVYLLERK